LNGGKKGGMEPRLAGKDLGPFKANRENRGASRSSRKKRRVSHTGDAPRATSGPRRKIDFHKKKKGRDGEVDPVDGTERVQRSCPMLEINKAIGGGNVAAPK